MPIQYIAMYVAIAIHMYTTCCMLLTYSDYNCDNLTAMYIQGRRKI